MEFVGARNGACLRGLPRSEVEVVSSVPSGYSQRHEGHCNWSSFELLKYWEEKKKNFTNGAQHMTPHIALVHMGTNDVINMIRSKRTKSKHLTDLNSTLQNIRGVVEILHSMYPSCIIYLAQITQNQYDVQTEYLNRLIYSMVSTLSVEWLKGVAMKGFSAATHTVDTTHPNENGEKVMAARWFDAIYTEKKAENQIPQVEKITSASDSVKTMSEVPKAKEVISSIEKGSGGVAIEVLSSDTGLPLSMNVLALPYCAPLLLVIAGGFVFRYRCFRRSGNQNVRVAS